MTLSEWVEAQGRGAMADLQRATGLAYTTVFYAARGKAVRYQTAKLLSAATDGEVSIEALVEPPSAAAS